MFHVATRASSGVQEVVIWKGLFLGPQRQEKLETQIRASPRLPERPLQSRRHANRGHWRLSRQNHCRTHRSKSLTVLVSPLDMLGLMGMAQVLAAVAYGIKGVRRGETTWQWPDFVADPTLENQAQMARWSINVAPGWHFPPLAIANQYRDRETNQPKRQRYRLVLVKCSRYEWIARERSDEVYAAVTTKHPWMPVQTLPSSCNETILFGYAADFTPLPTYICLSSGLYRARTGRIVEKEGRHQEFPHHPSQCAANSRRAGQRDTACKSRHWERQFQTTWRRGTRDTVLAAAYKNQAENGPTHAELLFERVNISESRWIGIAKLFVKSHGRPFFFRPAPLWLSPGRRTLSCWWTNYANAFTVSFFGGLKVEQNHYKVVPVPKRKTNKDTTKNKHPQPTPQTTLNKNKTQKGTWHDGSKKQWHQVLLN